MFGKDFFKILEFVMAIIRLMCKVFGDDEDKKNADDFGCHGTSGSDTIIKETGNGG